MTARHAGVLSALLAAASLAASGLDAQPSNVPDLLTRQSGLRLTPMSRPAQTYATNCQGCHGESGRSVPEIPVLAGRVGYFARVPEGRRYLVQVPNVALNPSSDADIAEVLNWLLVTYSRAQLPPDFSPYTASEVGELRRARVDVVAARRRVVEALLAAGQIPSADALALPQPLPYALAASDRVAAGREKFVPCATCHGADGRSSVVPQYPKIGGQSAPYVVIALKAYRDGRRQGTFATMMAATARSLSDDDIEDLAAYIESLETAQ